MEEAERPLRITPDMLLGRRLDLERRMPRLPPVTVGLLAILATIFFLETTRGALGSAPALIRAGALVREAVLGGEWWRLVTMIFLHGSVEHLLGNALALYVLGMVSEHAFGRVQFAFLFLMSGIAGSVLSMMLSLGPSVGASGAIFGLQGAAVVLFSRHRARLLVRSRRIGVVLIAWALFTIMLGFTTPYVDNGAHIGGFLAGMLIARRLHPVALEPPPPEVKARMRRQAWVTAAVLAAATLGWIAS
jgi:rhomboid protease GluP